MAKFAKKTDTPAVAPPLIKSRFAERETARSLNEAAKTAYGWSTATSEAVAAIPKRTPETASTPLYRFVETPDGIDFQPVGSIEKPRSLESIGYTGKITKQPANVESDLTLLDDFLTLTEGSEGLALPASTLARLMVVFASQTLPKPDGRLLRTASEAFNQALAARHGIAISKDEA